MPERAQVDGGEHAQRLHEDRALRPRRLAQDLASLEGRPEWSLEGGPVTRKVAGAQEPAQALRESADEGGDVAAIEAPARGGDARLAMAAALRVGLDEPSQRAGERGLHEEVADRGRAPAGIEHGRSARRIEVELVPAVRNLEQPAHVFVHGEAALGVLHGRREHLPERLGPVRFEHRQIRVHGAGHRERQVRLGSGTGGDAIEPATSEEGNRGQGRRGTLAAHGARIAGARIVDEGHALAAERVGRGGLHHGGGKPRGHGGVEGVAAGQQHAHAGHGHQRMARRHHPLRARHHWSRGGTVRGVVLRLVMPFRPCAHGSPFSTCPGPSR